MELRRIERVGMGGCCCCARHGREERGGKGDNDGGMRGIRG